MNKRIRTKNDLLKLIVEKLDIPRSLYEKASARHNSLGEWLLRDESTVKDFIPNIRPQGSFRYGTVNRPLDESKEYDLDNVCVLTELSKTKMTQEQLKTLFGAEIKSYAIANSMLSPIEECNRCWRLRYADEVNFHLDTLPCVPEEQIVINRLIESGASENLARRAVAITDIRHPEYSGLTDAWLSSNPRGFATWFEQQCELGRIKASNNFKAQATIEDVPSYEWKTPLQQSIQILKRHRDVMFKDNKKLAPISMIITNLAAQAYLGETDLVEALTNIVQKIPDFVRSGFPRIPNPADPMEDYADKWLLDSRLEKSFWDWHYRVKADLSRLLPLPDSNTLKTSIERIFDISIPDTLLPFYEIDVESPKIISSPSVVIPRAAKPWGK